MDLPLLSVLFSGKRTVFFVSFTETRWLTMNQVLYSYDRLVLKILLIMHTGDLTAEVACGFPDNDSE